MNLTLGTDSAARKDIPVYGGFLQYFPAAIAGVARHSKRGNDKHNPGEPLHHARGKSMDHEECVARHLLDISDMEAAIKRDDPVIARLHPAAAAILEEADALVWRAAALSQRLYETYGGAPLAPGARLPEAVKAAPDPNPIKPLFQAKCCKCGKVDLRDKPVKGVYFCSYGCT